MERERPTQTDKAFQLFDESGNFKLADNNNNAKNHAGSFILFTNIGEAKAGKSQTFDFFIQELSGKPANVFEADHSATSRTQGADIFILQWDLITQEY